MDEVRNADTAYVPLPMRQTPVVVRLTLWRLGLELR
jgi:hypothetical protein